MNTYKLKFINHTEAKSTFLALGVTKTINNEGVDKTIYANGTQAIVKLQPQTKIKGVYGEDFEVITEPIFYAEVFYDIMTSDVIDFGVNEIFPTTAAHSFYRKLTGAQ